MIKERGSLVEMMAQWLPREWPGVQTLALMVSSAGAIGSDGPGISV